VTGKIDLFCHLPAALPFPEYPLPRFILLVKNQAMAERWSDSRWILSPTSILLALLCWSGVGSSVSRAGPPEACPDTLPAKLSLNDAVVWALQHNPELAAVRQQHGIAAAGIVIANTYPFNPIWEGKIRPADGPLSAGITNRVSNEHKFLIDVEIRGQRKFRRQSAYAALSRTDWEIAFQETSLAVRVLRAFNALLYRREKLQVLEQMVQVNQGAADEIEKQVKLAHLRPADLTLIRAEVADARAQMELGRTALVPAKIELRRAMGLIDEEFQPLGILEAPLGTWDAGLLTETALTRRADLHGRQAAVAEAEAKVNLAIADRFGNPNLGPAYEYDPTRINLIGAQITLPLPVFNTHRGEIMQRQAERTRAFLEVQQTEVLIRQEVHGGLERLNQARALLRTYQETLVPMLEKSRTELNQLLRVGGQGVTALTLIDINRKLLKAREAELDARWELKQAQLDLAAAVGEPALGINPNAILDPPPSCFAAQP
jgi:cobalt-zinc-cadmium efflux system outer membrane protein